MKKIPNCTKCKWNTKDMISIYLANYTKCGAQAFRFSEDVYNNRVCKKLYEEK